jgi:TPR repeat protein
MLRDRAERGDPEAQYNMGKFFAKGAEVKRNMSEAVKWYRKAAEQGYAMAQYKLGASYYNGEGVAPDKAAAARWYRRAAEQGHVGAQVALAWCYQSAMGVPLDQVEAVRWYREAAEQGHVDAQCNFALSLLYGKGIARDAAAAVRWLRMAAERGHKKAQYHLGLCFEQGEGIPQDKTEAVRWYTRAAHRDYTLAQNALGVCYSNGEGVAQDKVEAAKWFRKAADLGNSDAEANLACCLSSGFAAGCVTKPSVFSTGSDAADVPVQSIQVIPMLWPADRELPELVDIAAGAMESAAHQAQVTIETVSGVSGVRVPIRLVGGKGRCPAAAARLVMGEVTAIGDGAAVTVKTGENGRIAGVLTSSDVDEYCSIRAGDSNVRVQFTAFDCDGDDAHTSALLRDIRGDFCNERPLTPGTHTNYFVISHHRYGDHRVPLVNHQIRMYAEELVWLDTNGAVRIAINTPEQPSDVSGASGFMGGFVGQKG